MPLKKIVEQAVEYLNDPAGLFFMMRPDLAFNPKLLGNGLCVGKVSALQ
jgi:hypothetical protein